MRGLVDQVRIPPQYGNYKVYIIDEVHMLSTSAFNAFLKTLEEPPKYAIFILATTEKHKILPTILSRCQIFDFHRIGLRPIMEHLKNVATQEGITTEDEALYIIAQKADGGLRDALSVFDRVVSFSGQTLTYKDVINNLNLLDFEFYFKAADYALANNLSALLLLFDEILQDGFDAHNFLSGFAEHLRNVLVSKDINTLKLLEVSDQIKLKFQVQAREATMGWLVSALNVLNLADTSFKASKNQRLHVEMSLIKLAHLTNAIRLADEKFQVQLKK